MLKPSVLFAILLAVAVRAEDFSLTGRISSFHFGKFIDSCRIVLVPMSPTAQADSTVTDSTGSYYFPIVPMGVYDVLAQHDLYLEKRSRITIAENLWIDFQLYEKTHVLTDTSPQILTKEVSPLFVPSTMEFTNELNIGPGVVIYYQGTFTISGPSLAAAGSADDPVQFIPIDDSGSIVMVSADQKLTNCIFSGGDRISICCNVEQSGRAYIDSCIFIAEELSLASSVLYVSNSLLRAKTQHTIRADSLFFTGNNLNTTMSHNGSSSLIVDSHCRISDNDFPTTVISLNSSGDTVINNIFWLLNMGIPAGGSVFFAYNCVKGFLPGSSATDLEGIGKTVTTNSNGYPCDLYFNIFTDAKINYPETGQLAIQSPCLNAGVNGEHIGVWKNEPWGNAVRWRKLRQDRKRNPAEPYHALILV